MAGVASRRPVVLALVVSLALVVGCCPSRNLAVELSDATQPLGDRVPDESSLLVTREDVIELAETLGLKPGVRPWQIRLVAQVPRGWAWVVSNTEYSLDNGSRGGVTYKLSAETGELLDFNRWELLPMGTRPLSMSDSAETAN